MYDQDPLAPPPSGNYPPPPPSSPPLPPNYPPPPPSYPPPQSYPVTSDIPPQSPYHYSAAPAGRKRSGVAGGVLALLAGAFAYGKYALLVLFKLPFLLTVGTALLSVLAYSVWGGWTFAIGLVLMIFIHEMGHVVEIRRQGMAATAPVFIPFMGAAIFQRSHAQSPIKQAQIGIAGPIAGTFGAAVAMIFYGTTHWTPLLGWAYWGFLINLFNMIPVGMLDGGWILAPVSKWLQVAGLGLLAILFFAGFVSPLVIVVVLIGVFMLIQRFRNPALDHYLTSGPASARYALGAAWLGLVLFLAYGLFQTDAMLQTLVR